MKRLIDTSCPGCQEKFQVPVDIPEITSDQLSQAINEIKGAMPPGVTLEQIQGLLEKQLKPPELEAHRHKTFDELADCPECQLWIEKTGQRYQLGTKRETPQTPVYKFGALTQEKEE